MRTMRPTLERKHLAATCLGLLIVVSLLSGQGCEAKKKEKKIVKSLVKSLVLKNLSTRKNFLPLPVPIPGKWQSALENLSSRGEKLSSASSTANKKVASAAAVVAAATGPNRHSAPNGGSMGSLLSLSKLDFNSVQKLARLSIAKNVNKFGKTKTMVNNLPKASASIKKVVSAATDGSSSATIAAHKLSSLASSSNIGGGSKKSEADIAVTLFNFVKLLKQIGETDASMLMRNMKKATGNPFEVVSKIGLASQQPLLSMNINNRKTFMNKMNYLHTITQTFANSAHRNSHRS